MSEKAPVKLLILRTVLVVCGIAVAGIILGEGYNIFFGAPPLAHQVVASVAAPGGRLTAVLTKISGDKDSGYLVDVNAITGESERAANFYSVKKPNGQAGLDMVWQGDRTLELRYQSATVARIDQRDITIDGGQVTIVLKPGQ